MGLLERLFGRRQANRGSTIRIWAAAELRGCSDGERDPIDVLFASMMYDASTLSDPQLPTTGRASPRYSNDACTFEVACYLWFRIDRWLFSYYPPLRGAISGELRKRLVSVCARVLILPYLNGALADRAEIYRQAAMDGLEPARCHARLASLLRIAARMGFPEVRGEGLPMTIDGIHEQLLLNGLFQTLEAVCLPRTFEYLAEVCGIR